MQNITKIDDHHYEIRITYINPLDNKRKSVKRRVHGSLTRARQVRAELQVQIAQGEIKPPKIAEKTVGGWTDDYLAAAKKRLAVTSYESEERYIKQVAEYVKDWNPSAIKVSYLHNVTERWADLTKDDGSLLSAATVRHMVGALKRLLKFVMRKTCGDLSILLHLEAPELGKRPKRRGTAHTAKEAAKFLKAMKQRYPQFYALVYLLAATGQRFGSVSALRKSDICDDWITFSTSQFRGVVKEGNKTDVVVRLPITPDIRKVLDWHLQRMEDINHPNKDMDILFPTCKPAEETTSNGYMYGSLLRNPFIKCCEAAEVPQITPHDLRRTFNSIQIEAGTSGTILRSITAHSSSAMTDRYYFGSRDAKEAAINTVTNLLQ